MSATARNLSIIRVASPKMKNKLEAVNICERK